MENDGQYKRTASNNIIFPIALTFYILLFMFVLILGISTLTAPASSITTEDLFYAERFQGWATVLVTATILLVGYILYHKESESL